MGETQGAVSKKNNAYNAGVSTVEVEVRSEDADLAYQTSAQALEILSDDAVDDGLASGTLTLASATALVAATGTVVCAGVLAADTVTVNGLVYTAVAGAKADNTEFSIDTGDNECAADLADSITNDSRTGTLDDVTATSSTDTVTMTQTVKGAGGNATTLVSSNGTRLAVSGATFSGGTDADTATVNGLVYTAVAGAKANNTEFSIDTSDTAAAADLADSINNDARTPITEPTVNVLATAASAVVTIDADIGGAVGNNVDIAGTANITASGATLTGGLGTGAQTVLVEGLDASYNEISETVSLNGTTVRPLLLTYLRVNKATVGLVGTGLENAGLITIRLASAGAVQITIPATEGVSQVSNFTPPLGKEISIKSLDYSVESSAGNALVVTIKLFKKLFGSGWELVDSKTLGNGPGTFEFANDELEMPQRTDIKITAIKLTGTGDARVDASYGFREYNKTT